MKFCLACHQKFEATDWHCPHCGHIPPISEGILTFAPDLAKINEGFSEGYFSQLFSLEAGHFWFRSRNQLLLWALQYYFPHSHSFLEIGCGTGFVLSAIRQKFPLLTLAGSEIFSQGLTFAKQRLPGVTLLQMDARQIPFEQEFDVIGAFDVLEHIEEDETVLLQMFQACKPGGGIIITVPQHRFLWSIVDENAFHKRRYAKGELITKVKKAGFEVLRTTSFVSLLLPLMILSRFHRNNNKDFDELAEYKISHLANTILYSILAFERFFINQGASFCLGGSLLLVAQKS